MASEHYPPDEMKVVVATDDFRRSCCPICGGWFDEVRPVNVCGYGHQSLADELISDSDDYAWVQ